MKIDSKWIIVGLCAVIIFILAFGIGSNNTSKTIINNLEVANEVIQKERDSIAILSIKLQKENKDLYTVIDDRDNKLVDERESSQRQRKAYEKYIKGLRLNTAAELDSAINELWPKPEGLSDTSS
jgi:hypothetical protein